MMMERLYRFGYKKLKLIYFVLLLFVFISLLAYYLLIIYNYDDNFFETPSNFENEIQSRLLSIEKNIASNRLILQNVKKKIETLSQTLNQYSNLVNKWNLNLTNSCNESKTFKQETDIENIYKVLSFENVDGGVWKQGWNIEIDWKRLNSQMLHIFVVPHSHNDPGWIKTFDQYFETKTRNILNIAIQKLSENPNLTFIWAEISYFAKWWESLKDESVKQNVKTLLNNGQFEIVTGGWVMNDEANSHYFSMLSQLVDGHEWLLQNLNYIPHHGWAIDQFGASPTMTYLLKNMGFKGMVIQRVHYAIKKFLAQNKMLEFKWGQVWNDQLNENSILCHIEPFYSYDIPHTCGPDPKICCQFDFERLAPSKMACPWKATPKKITPQNVEERSALLLDQYRKKAMLYKTNRLLVPLGDDFRFDKQKSWSSQTENYQKLMNYMNSRKDWNVQIKFGTLADYFDSFNEKIMPSFTGDFFTYADRDDNYWSGYYTTRPFFKILDRLLASYLRGAEILFSFGLILSKIDNSMINKIRSDLNYARKNFALFQHHDAITGTSKDQVVKDYGIRLVNSINKCQKIISILSFFLLDNNYLKNKKSFEFMEKFEDIYFLQVPQPLLFNSSSQIRKKYLIVYNSLARTRREIICIYMPKILTDWVILDQKGEKITNIQLNKVFQFKEENKDINEVCFVVFLDPLSLNQFTIEKVNRESKYTFSETILYNANNDTEPTPSNIEISSEFLKLIVNGADGMLRKVYRKQNNFFFQANEVRLQFMSYETRKEPKAEKSGAYIFLPDSPKAQPLLYTNPIIRVIKGPLMSSIEVLIEKPFKIMHKLIIFENDNFFDIESSLLLQGEKLKDREVILRFFTNINSENIFYTDLNGFQMQRRTWYDKIPLQGNIYPISTLAYIEDNLTRFNILTNQPLGTTSTQSGLIDIFLDRRLFHDDQRGLGQGITDNRAITEKFRVIIEPKTRDPLKPSLKVQLEHLNLFNQLFVMQSDSASSESAKSLMSFNLPCDIHLLNFRSNLTSLKETFLFLHRFSSACEANCFGSHYFKLSSHLTSNVIQSLDVNITEMSLSLNQAKSNLSLEKDINLKEMDISVFKFTLKS